MTRVWGIEAGDRNVFALRLTFQEDPHDGRGAEVDEALSWGQFELWAGGKNLCLNQDQGVLINGASWYLLPLLEWFVWNWDPLLHEERIPLESPQAESAARATFPLTNGLSAPADLEDEQFEWWERHALRAARDGGLLPNVFIRRVRDAIEVSWADEESAGEQSSFSFLADEGVVYVDPDSVARPLFDVIEAAVDRLLEWQPESPRFRELHTVLLSIADEGPEREERRLSWLAGVISSTVAVSSISERLLQGWRNVVNAFRLLDDEHAVMSAFEADAGPLVVRGSCDAALLFGATSPRINEHDSVVLARLLVSQFRAQSLAAHPLVAEMSTPTIGGNKPWRQGQELALAVFDEFHTGEQFFDIRAVLARLEVQVEELELEDISVRAISVAGVHHQPTVALNRASAFAGSEAGVRFSLAHELCHLLFDWTHGVRLAIATGPWAPRAIEQRANAFGAMLLMHPNLVSAAMASASAPFASREWLRELSTSLNVNQSALAYHLRNLGEIEPGAADALLGPIHASWEDHDLDG